MDRPIVRTVAIVLGALIALAIAALALRRRTPAPAARELSILPGARVGEIEAALARDAAGGPPAPEPRRALADPAEGLRDHARELATKDPTRAAHILKAWISQDRNSPSNRSAPHA
jgi:flagellar M-ring protein FliF